MRRFSAKVKPDWRSESDYNYVDQLTLPQLAFEFLRRNPGYIQDHQVYSEIEANLTSTIGPKDSYYELWKSDGREAGTIWDPTRNPGESSDAYLKRTIVHPCEPKRYWYEDWFHSRWGIEGGFPSPNSQTQIELKFKTRWGFPFAPDYNQVALFFHGDSATHKPYSQVFDKAVLVFDLKSPFGRQLTEARKLLKWEAKNRSKESGMGQTKHFREQFKIYLRVWDGKACGENKKDVADKVFGEKAKQKAAKDLSDPDQYAQNCRLDAHKSAKEFVYYKYRTIPYYKDIKSNSE